MSITFTSVKTLLIQTLQEFGYPVFLQGSLNAAAPYPDSFFTFWNDETSDGSHYDNDAIYFIWDFTVNFYSTDPELVEQTIGLCRPKLKEQGFIVSGLGEDANSDEITHTGRSISASFIQINPFTEEN